MTTKSPIRAIRNRALRQVQQTCLWLIIGCACAATGIVLVAIIPRRVPVFNFPAPDLPTMTASAVERKAH